MLERRSELGVQEGQTTAELLNLGGEYEKDPQYHQDSLRTEVHLQEQRTKLRRIYLLNLLLKSIIADENHAILRRYFIGRIINLDLQPQ